jgi:enoyl-CoA hydratase/carnithine racemase
VIDLERHDDVFVLRLTKDDNRFNAESLAAWNAALDEVEAAAGPAALVTTGNGKFYSNGLDLDWVGRQESAVATEMISGVIRLMGRVLTLPVPTVAAVNGHAFAAGAMLTLAHDARVMRGDRGYFCIPEVDLGMPLAPGMAGIIRGRLPIGVAHEAILTGRRYGGDQAAELGIVDEAVAVDQVLPRAIERAAEQAGRAGPILATLKRGLYADLVPVLEAGALS